MSLNEQEILVRIEQARKSYAGKNYREAITLYNEVVEYIQEDIQNLPIIQIELGWSYYYDQQYGSAITALQQAMQSHTLNTQQQFDCLRLIGFCNAMLENRKEAVQYLEKAISIEVPETHKRFAYFELGKILFTDGQIIEAEHFLKTAQPLFDRDENQYVSALTFYLGFVEYFQKNYKQARNHFDQVIRSAEDHKTKAGGYFGLTHIYFHRKEYPVVLDLCEKILRLDNAFFDKESLGFFMCESYLHLKNWENLESFFTELKQNYPEGRYRKEYPKFDLAIQTRKIPASPPADKN